MPGRGRVGLDPLAGYWAKLLLWRDDLPHPYDTVLFRYRSQQGHRHVGFDVVLAHVAGVAAVVLQELHNIIDGAGQVDGHRHRLIQVHRRVLGGVLGGCFSRLHLGHQLVQVGAQVGVGQFRFFRDGVLVGAVSVGRWGADGHGNQQHRKCGKRQQAEEPTSEQGEFSRSLQHFLAIYHLLHLIVVWRN